MQRLLLLFARRPWLWLAMLVAASMLAATQIGQLQVRVSADEMLVIDDPQRAYYDRVKEIFGDEKVVLLVVDVEVVEVHHGAKVDAPSGTALMLGEAAAEVRGTTLEALRTPAREGITGPREPGSIGFSAIRGGDVVGEHDVIFAAEGERVVLRHRLTRSLLEGMVGIAGEVRSRGEGPLARIFSLILVGDLVATFLAERTGVDPCEVAVIRDFKSRLKEER